MLNQASARIYLCLHPMEMRKSFNTLAQVICDQLGGDQLPGFLLCQYTRC